MPTSKKCRKFPKNTGDTKQCSTLRKLDNLGGKDIFYMESEQVQKAAFH